jgi:Domain of unknown function (DUF4349)
MRAWALSESARRWGAALSLGVVLAVTTGCGGGAELAPAASSVARAGAAEPAMESEGPRAEPQAESVTPAFRKEVSLPALKKINAPAPPAASNARSANTGSAQPAGNQQIAPLLIYTAELTVAVFETERAIDRIEQAARAAGGYLVRRSDTSITVRVPAHRFQAALASVARVGDVLHQNVNVEDVTQRYTDLTLRLKNAEAVRDQLAELLKRAQAVKDALQVERELARVTEQIELMKGQLRMMRELIAYSTITVTFQPQPVEHVGPTVKLPFPWLDQLGLHQLLSL